MKVGGITGLAGGFSKLGMDAGTIGKFVPVFFRLFKARPAMESNPSWKKSRNKGLMLLVLNNIKEI
jgi:hypothetical protein